MKKIIGASLLCLVMSVIGIAIADDENTQTTTRGLELFIFMTTMGS